MIAQKIKVLLVEDSPSDTEFVRAALAENNPTGFALTVTCRLADAVAQLRQTRADVVLLDLGLPDSQGLGTLRQLSQACGAETAVVVLTSNEEEDLGPQALQLGAQDFLNKKHITNGSALQRCIRYSWERQQREVMARQLAQAQRGFEVARAIQEHMLPQQAPQVPGFDMAGIWQPAEATGGDFFDFLPMAEGRLGVVLADVAGHGFGPALIMAGTRRALRVLARANLDPGAVLTTLNETVCEDTTQERFVTLFLGCLNPADPSLVYAGAGHEAHLFDAQGRVTRLESTGLPLGFAEGSVYACAGPFPLEPGQLLLLLSDGFQEAYAASDGPVFGLPAALEYVRQNCQQTARTIVDGLVGTVRRFCHPTNPQDDMTAVVVKRG
jgi:DNA-binding NarL/FixJ family response regulator